MIERQATMLSYIDVFQLLALIFVLMTPLVFDDEETVACSEACCGAPEPFRAQSPTRPSRCLNCQASLHCSSSARALSSPADSVRSGGRADPSGESDYATP
jgi:hypothetical protein